MKRKKVYLTLENGKVFQGYRFGADGEATGEIVFTTGMVGYDKTLTDPAYYGQIVVQTFPLIGNYGVIASEMESEKSFVSAYVVREICDVPSNFRTEETLESYLKKQGVIGIYGVDTRELTRIIRSAGVMNARISSKPLENPAELSAYKISGAVEAVAPTEQSVCGDENANLSVAFWDFGAKESEVAFWAENGLKVVRVPAKATAEEILALSTNGIVISEGPGDPQENQAAIEEIKKLVGKKPIFAVGLGLQMPAIALGGKTVKMKYGHRGGNQPVKYLESGRVYVSSQNHGYEVLADSVTGGKITFVNVNDGGVEGVEYEAANAMGVQFAPSACSAALEPNFLTNKFIEMIK
ncbi:MAG: glutamine-hydrolyzing carbamoyl-phosphate synthase small subunit [Clostridia bacterium]|nr:glutamine-hydrolyzing carbamoyl-phosphate synthase small subunit [Clostridia bacterium]